MTYLDFINDFRNEVKCVKKYIIGHYEFRTYKKWIFKSGDNIKITRENITLTINDKQTTINFDNILCSCALPNSNLFVVSNTNWDNYGLRLK